MSAGATRRVCTWCDRRIRETARVDASYCSVRCRQAAHRAKVRRSELDAVLLPARLAYADPPYVGLARRYYGDQPSFAGEVDHSELVSRLARYDGFALSCSSASIPAIAALLVAADVESRLAIWHRRPAPHPTTGLITAYEGVFVRSARRVARGSDGPLTDVLTGVGGGRRSTLPGSVIGMKPPAFLLWIFGLMGARPGDTLDDLYPGSGMVARTWASWTGPDDASAVVVRDASRPARANATQAARRDASAAASRDG